MKFIRALDHPFMFIVFTGMALYGLTNIARWGADRAGIYGLKHTLPN